MDATTVAIDLAKDIFERALENRAGRIIVRKRLTHRLFERFIDGLPAGTASAFAVLSSRQGGSYTLAAVPHISLPEDPDAYDVMGQRMARGICPALVRVRS
jgi:hypothetical protein